MKWEEKDDIQKTLSIMASEVADALNNVLEYQYIISFMDKHDTYINEAPWFWSEVLISLRYAIIMRTARIVDESKDAIGIVKLINMIEQSPYRKETIDICHDIQSQYRRYSASFEEIKTLRDKIFAHNDSRVYRFWMHEEAVDIRRLEFDGDFWRELEDILRWIKEALYTLCKTCGMCAVR